MLSSLIAAALERLPSVDQVVGERIDERALHRSLTRRGVQIETVYDIGAHRGEWTNSVRGTLPEAQFFLFEANPAHEDALRETGERYFISVLSSEPKLVEFYATGGPGDSYFREATKHYAGVRPRTLHASTLDRLIEEHNLPLPDLIKADVQGSELDVLRGGRAALGNAKLVLLECPIVEYNEGAPNIHEYFEFMRAHGFGPIEFLDPIWNKRQMIQIDVLFAVA